MMDLVKLVSLDQMQLIPPLVVVLFIAYFLVRYLVQYRTPGRRISRELGALADQVAKLKKTSPDRIIDGLEDLFAKGNERVVHAWVEYKETLHRQFEPVDGELRLIKVRSTVQSGSFFADQNLVDTPLKAEYFRHLPGILTGIGIIGTFAGLLIGLQYFDAADPEKIQQSVSILLGGVRDAFVASAISIAVAMYITNSEKKYLRLCYEALERLTENLDGLFESGVGEEYLAALVKSSEESARQARQLKDGLVTDLREMLQNLVDSQVRESQKLAASMSAAYRESGEDLAASISSSIENSFKDPLTKIADSVQAATGTNSNQVQGLLQDVLHAFMAKLDATFGQQFNGMHEMMGQSVGAMQQMQGAFQSLIEDMRNAGESSSRAVSEQLSRALSDMTSGQGVMQAAMNEMIGSLQQAVAGIGVKGEEAGSRMAQQLERLFAESEVRQLKMAEGMQAFIDGMKEAVGKGQQDTMAEIAATVGQLGEQLAGVMQTLDAGRQNMSDGALQAQQRVQEGAEALVSGLGTQVQGMLEALHAQQQDSRQSVVQLGEVTSRSIEGMKDGADRMRLAAERFGSAGESALKLVDATGNAVQQLNASGGSVTTAVRELATQIAEYRAHREAVQKLMSSVEGMAATSQNEANARARMVAELSQVVAQMKDVNGEAATYMERIGEVLGGSFSAFGDGVEKSLRKTLGSLDQELDKAIKSLAGGVQELGDSVEELSGVLATQRSPR
jgi:putative membrane protein